MPTTVRARGQTRAQTGPFRGPGTALRMKDERCTTHGGSHGARRPECSECGVPECGERERSSSGKPEPRDPRRTAPHASRWRCRSPAGYSELYTKRTPRKAVYTPLPGRPRSLERSDRARVLNAHAHVYKYTHAHWSTTTGPYHYSSAQDTISLTGFGVYCCCPHAASS